MFAGWPCFGGEDFQKLQRIGAQLEASIAEQVADHPHLVCLLDALYDQPSGLSYLAYRFAGVELNKGLVRSLGVASSGSPSTACLASSACTQ